MAMTIQAPNDSSLMNYLVKNLVKEVTINMGASTTNLYCLSKDINNNLRIPMMFFRKLWPSEPMKNYLELPRRQILCKTILGEGNRGFQLDTYNNAVASLLTTRGIYISLMCGGGKTKIGTKIAADFGLKAAFLVDATLIFPQWVKVMKEDTNALVAEISSPVDVLPEADFYVIMIESAKKMKPETLAPIKFLIIDEALYFITPGRIQGILNFTPSYIMGLCAEIKRDDKMECLLPHLFGDNLIRKINDKPFTVYRINTTYEPVVKYQKYKGTTDWTTVLQSLAENEDRNMDIIDLCRSDELKESKIIIGTKLKEQANFIYNKLIELGEACCLLTENARTITQCRILVGIYSKMGKGVDVINLCPDWQGEVFDAAIIGLDMCKPEQFVGRVFRHPNPKVYHYVDNNSTLKKHFDEKCLPWYTIRNAVIIESYLPPRRGAKMPVVLTTENVGKKKGGPRMYIKKK